MTDVRRVSSRRRFVAVLAAFVLAVAGVFVHGAPARSEENNAIKFGPVTLTHVTETGDPVPAPGRQLLRGNFFFLDISFDATTANPQPGDTFSISIPEPFVNRDAGNSQREVIKPLMVGATQSALQHQGQPHHLHPERRGAGSHRHPGDAAGSTGGRRGHVQDQQHLRHQRAEPRAPTPLGRGHRRARDRAVHPGHQSGQGRHRGRRPSTGASSSAAPG